ncbi:MAG TPA: hypothetical protein VGM39_19980 [Kofleriaceae bacterium]|jgi:hypothetical protein
MHSLQVSVGDQVFIDQALEEVGAVRQVTKDHLVIYIENAGDFVVKGNQVKSASNGKLVLDSETAEPALLAAAKKAHVNETD